MLIYCFIYILYVLGHLNYHFKIALLMDNCSAICSFKHMLIRIERLKVTNYAFKGGLYLIYLQIYIFRKIMGPLVIQNLTQIKLCLENNRLLKLIYFHCIMGGQRLIPLFSGKTGIGFKSDYLNHLCFSLYQLFSFIVFILEHPKIIL